jgi:Rrf2 family protein
MRLTRAGEYAVRAVLYLAKQKKGALVSRREIASRTDVPAHFLAKIAQQLARAGIIEIQQGSSGGFRLRQAPAELPLLAVVEAIIG